MAGRDVDGREQAGILPRLLLAATRDRRRIQVVVDQPLARRHVARVERHRALEALADATGSAHGGDHARALHPLRGRYARPVVIVRLRGRALERALQPALGFFPFALGQESAPGPERGGPVARLPLGERLQHLARLARPSRLDEGAPLTDLGRLLGGRLA